MILNFGQIHKILTRNIILQSAEKEVVYLVKVEHILCWIMFANRLCAWFFKTDMVEKGWRQIIPYQELFSSIASNWIAKIKIYHF